MKRKQATPPIHQGQLHRLEYKQVPLHNHDIPKLERDVNELAAQGWTITHMDIPNRVVFMQRERWIDDPDAKEKA